MQTPRSQTWRIYTTANLTVSASAAVTSALDKRGFSVVGLVIPTIDSASVSATVSVDGTTYHALKSEAGAAVSFMTASTGSCALSGGSAWAYLEPWPYVKFTLGAGQTGGSRAISAVMQG
jgi:hypothetical protein